MVLAENEDWVLVMDIPNDYATDGYRVYRKEYISSRYTKEEENAIANVLSLKGIRAEMPDNFQFDTALALLQWSEKEFGIFEFQDDSEDEVFFGTLNKVLNADRFIIDMVLADGGVEVEYDYEFELDEIRFISFQSDYFNSVLLLKDNKEKKR